MSGVIGEILRKPEQQIFLFLLICAGVLLTALGLEFLAGYAPCELCLKERWAYYAGVPLAIAAIAAIGAGRTSWAAGLIGLAGLGLLANAGLGLYHAGVEQLWWAGPNECTGGPALAQTPEDLLKQLQTQKIVRCDQPALYILGLSLAAWNVPVGLGLAALGGFASRQLLTVSRKI
jgi:disulfide bond formation protein DsbB